MNQVHTIDDGSFSQEVLEHAGDALVDFWAPWCGPCRRLAPVLESVAARFSGRLKVAKLNVDENRVWAGRLGVQGIPALILFRAGQPVGRLVGFRPEVVLSGELEKLLGSEAAA